ncbi:hypothetical protein G6F65_022107 [Rhizopus arrhizus]|nr:hypothetical protein G6F65_022107 [Rhizopus arrhizus]
MSDPISAVLDVHDSPRARNDSLGMLLSLAAEQPRQLGELMLQALARRSPGSAFLDMALDLMPDEVVPAVALPSAEGAAGRLGCAAGLGHRRWGATGLAAVAGAAARGGCGLGAGPGRGR